jgi:hypothetical protein
MGIVVTMPILDGASLSCAAILGLRYLGVRYLAIFDTLQVGISPLACIFLIASAREQLFASCNSATRSASAIFSKSEYTLGRPLPDLTPPRFDAFFLGDLVVLSLLATVFPVL